MYETMLSNEKGLRIRNHLFIWKNKKLETKGHLRKWEKRNFIWKKEKNYKY